MRMVLWKVCETLSTVGAEAFTAGVTEDRRWGREQQRIAHPIPNLEHVIIEIRRLKVFASARPRCFASLDRDLNSSISQTPRARANHMCLEPNSEGPPVADSSGRIDPD